MENAVIVDWPKERLDRANARLAAATSTLKRGDLSGQSITDMSAAEHELSAALDYYITARRGSDWLTAFEKAADERVTGRTIAG